MRSFLAALALALVFPTRAGDAPGPCAPASAPLPGDVCPSPPLGISPGIVDGPTAHRLVAAGVRVVDVRTPAEFAAGHVPGALNIPHDEMALRYAELGPPTTALLLYCKAGARSALAIQVLRSKGFVLLYDLQAFDRWARS